MSTGTEKLYKNREWLYEQYVVLGKTMGDLAVQCQVDTGTIGSWLRKYKIKLKSKKEISEIKIYRSQKTCLERYGVPSPFESKEIQKKIEQMNIDKYGVNRPFQDKKTQEKAKETVKQMTKEEKEQWQNRTKETWIQKYGVDNPGKCEEIKEKMKKTCLERYGVDHPWKSEEVKKKIKEKNLEKYGFSNPMMCEEVQIKRKKTCLGRYGVDNLFQSKEYRKICLEKYGFEAPIRNRDIQLRGQNTKKRNGSYSRSKSEDLYYEYLIKNIDSLTERQVRHKGFNIDFYLPSWDVYIQFDGDYWHGYMDSCERLMKSNHGKDILATMKRDKEQNETISNLVRIRESEFIK